MNIGDRVKTLRKELGLSQIQLAEGVCSQAAISKMENQNFIPSADILYKLSQKMGVPISYLLELSVDERVDYIEEVSHQLTRLFEKRSYQEALEVVLAEWNNPTFKNTRFKRMLLWRRGVCLYYIDNDAEAAIKYIDGALKLSETTSFTYDEMDIEFLLSKATIYSSEKAYSEALNLFKKIFSYLRKNQFIQSSFLLAKAFYNYGLTLRRSGQYEEALLVFNKGIAYCHDHYILYSLGDSYFYSALTYIDLNNPSRARDYYNQAKMVYTIMGNTKMVDVTEEQIALL